MGSLGGPEILFIFILGLLLFGPRKLPEIGRTLGKALAEFRKATMEFRTSLEREVEMEKIKETTGMLESAVKVAHPVQTLKDAVLGAVDLARPSAPLPPIPTGPAATLAALGSATREATPPAAPAVAADAPAEAKPEPKPTTPPDVVPRSQA